MTISFHFSETSSILCSILAQICSGCQWPLPLCTNSYFALTKYPVKSPSYTHISISCSYEAVKTTLLIASRTILCVGLPSWRMGPLSWRTLTGSSCRSLHEKHKFPAQAVQMCKRSHPPHTLSLEY